MRTAIFIALMFLLVPVQTTILDAVSPFGIRPDLCLVAAYLAGILTGQFQGFLLGFGLGFVQDLFSTSDLWLNTITKSGVGFFAGLVAKNLANVASSSAFFLMVVFSFFSGVLFLVVSRGGMEMTDTLLGIQTILLPQACLDGLLALVLYWIMTRGNPEPSTL